jgi:hypothetical protein
VTQQCTLSAGIAPRHANALPILIEIANQSPWKIA